MRLRAVCFVLFAGFASCGDDTQPLAPDASMDAPGGLDGSMADAAANCTLSPTRPASDFFYYDQLTIASDTSRTITVQDGFEIHGTVSAAMLPQDTLQASGNVLIWANPNEVYEPSVGNLSVNGFTYSVTAPPGTYSALFSFGVYAGDLNHYVERTRYATLTLCGDMTYDVQFPDLDAGPSKSVQITGLGAFSADLQAIDVAFYNQDRTRAVAVLQTPYAGGSSISLSVDLPDESLTPYVTLNLAGSVNILKLDPLPVSSSYAIAVPSLAKISGTLTNADPLSSGASSVYCYSVASPYPPNLVDHPGDEGSWATIQGSGTYSLYVRPGITCSLHVESPIAFVGGSGNGSESSSGALFVPPPTAASRVMITSDTTRDFSVPTPASNVTVTLTVVDLRNTPLPGYALGGGSSALAGANLSGAGFAIGGATTDSSGQVRLHVIPGSYDRLHGSRIQ